MIKQMTRNPFYIGGKIRSYPSDFIVEEVWDNRIWSINYSILQHLRDQLLIKTQSSARAQDYLHFTLVKNNWDTIQALNQIRKRLHVSLKRFGFSGMKDKRAITAQRVSLWKGKADVVAQLRLSDIVLKNFKYAQQRINLGNASGNRFTIIIRNVVKPANEVNNALKLFKEKISTQGIPNYFGPQRFSGGNALVGKALKNGDLKLGVELILNKIQPYLHRGDIESIPRVFWYEKRMLRHLQKLPNDYAGALRRIPKRIRRLYLHAYQSSIFNQQLDQVISDHNIPPFLIIPGFKVDKMPELSTISIKRKSVLTLQHFEVKRIHNHIVNLQFTLGKGEYASTLLLHLVTENQFSSEFLSETRI